MKWLSSDVFGAEWSSTIYMELGSIYNAWFQIISHVSRTTMDYCDPVVKISSTKGSQKMSLEPADLFQERINTNGNS